MKYDTYSQYDPAHTALAESTFLGPHGEGLDGHSVLRGLIAPEVTHGGSKQCQAGG